MDVGWRELAVGVDELQRGDEYLIEGQQWRPTALVGVLCQSGLYNVRYRRRVEGPQQQITALRTASNEVDLLKDILTKENEHIAVIESNNRGRDKAIDVGVSLRGMRDQFAARYRDRVFIVGDRVVDTDGGRYQSRKAEVVL